MVRFARAKSNTNVSHTLMLGPHAKCVKWTQQMKSSISIGPSDYLPSCRRAAIPQPQRHVVVFRQFRVQKRDDWRRGFSCSPRERLIASPAKQQS